MKKEQVAEEQRMKYEEDKQQEIRETQAKSLKKSKKIQQIHVKRL